MKVNAAARVRQKLACMPWFFLTLIVFLLSATIVFAVIPHSLAAQVTMEVYQQEGRKAFGKETQLDIFNDPKLEGKSLVHPFTKGSYVFAVYNNSNSDPLPYSLDITGTNLEDIPLVFNLQKNGEYIFGGEDFENMLPFSEIDFGQVLLDGQKTDLYTIKWQWKTENDVIDTAIGDNGTQLYTLVIRAIGTIPEVTELSPKTGIHFNLLLCYAVMFVSLALLIILAAHKRRKNKDESNQAVIKNM